jgi:hypothetical protein
MMSSIKMHSLFATSPTRFSVIDVDVICLIVIAKEIFSTPAGNAVCEHLDAAHDR